MTTPRKFHSADVCPRHPTMQGKIIDSRRDFRHEEFGRHRRRRCPRCGMTWDTVEVDATIQKRRNNQ